MDSRLSSRLRLALLFCAVGAVFLMLAGQASATHVQCGDTITQDTTLDSDLINCPGTGIIVGADNVTLDLNGHTIDGTNTGSFDETAGVLARGRDSTTVEDGSVREFAVGVLEDPSMGGGTTLKRLDISQTLRGFYPSGLDATFTRNFFHDNEIGIEVEGGSGATIRHNRFERHSFGAVHMNSATDQGPVRIEHNTMIDGGIGLVDLGCCHPTASAPVIIRHNVLTRSSIGLGITNAVVVEHNTIDGGLISIATAAFNSVVKNVVRNSPSDGIRTTNCDGEYPPNLIGRNVVTGSADDGIDMDCSGSVLTKNTANNNADLGIEAVPGTIDGGGNRAFGNGNPLQCLNVVCK